ncbi:MAG TPA: transglycosylase domain-containing protein, partial [Thermomicrobiales bacterium]|nr:transglycosylase domain-containing protein [Thermomicrobiales bacterium]
VVTLFTIALFSLLGLIVANRLLLRTTPRALAIVSHLPALVVMGGVWLAIDHRLLPGEPFLPLSDGAYQALVFISLLAVPVAYVLMSVEVGLTLWSGIRERWRAGRRIQTALGGVLLALWITVVSGPVVVGLYLAWWYEPPANSLILSSNDTLLDFRNPGYSTLRLPADQIPLPMLQAAESIEDPGLLRSPASHSPVNPVRLMSSAINMVTDGPSSGGSGLASQVCKVWSGTPLSRGGGGGWSTKLRRGAEKILETPCAWTLEKVGGPERTIELWLNTVNYACLGPYGASEVRGLGAASSVFFGKAAGELTLEEMALLARLPQNPCGLFAWGETGNMLAGRNQVIAAMSERQGYLTTEDADYYQGLPLGVPETPNMPPNRAQPFVEQVMGVLGRQGYKDFSRNGWKIATTLELGPQQALEDACNRAVAAQAPEGANDCGAVLLRRSGSDPAGFTVAAYVGTVHSISGPDAMPDIVLDEPLPVGSTIKGPLYACALHAGVLAPDEWLDDPGIQAFPGLEDPIADWDSEPWGTRSASEMLTGSRNVPAAELVRRLTPEGFARCLDDRFGVASPLNMSLSLRLGLGLSEIPLYELATGYTPFATGGVLVDPVMVQGAWNRDGVDQSLRAPARPREVITCEESTWVTNALLAVGEGYGLPWGVAAKTGTTDASSVAVAYSRDWVLATWLGRIAPEHPLQQVEPAPSAITVVQEYSWYLDQNVIATQLPACPESSVRQTNETGAVARFTVTPTLSKGFGPEMGFRFHSSDEDPRGRA